MAARLEAQARPGETVIEADAFQQVAERFPDAIPETLTLKGFREPVPSYRLGPATGLLAPTGAAIDGAGRGRALSLGAFVFAILGAPCAAVALIGPLAVVLGLGSLFGALSTNVFPVLDSAPVRLPLLTLATLGALANLYTVWHARQLRERARAEERFIPVTRLERRRTLAVTVAAVLTLLAVAYELYAHQFVTHHPWP